VFAPDIEDSCRDGGAKWGFRRGRSRSRESASRCRTAIYLARTGGYNPQFAGSGVFPEAAALIHQGVVAGVAWQVKFQAGPAPVPTWALAP
jgi:hypothetical protein